MIVALDDAGNQRRTLARLELIETDGREERFVEHPLQLAVQAAMDVGAGDAMAIRR